MVIGRIGSGKSSIICNVLKKSIKVESNVNVMINQSTIDSPTSKKWEGNIDDIDIKFFEIGIPYESLYSTGNNNVLSEIFNNPPDQINLICFVIGNGKITENDYTLFSQIIDHVNPDLKEYCCLIITNCESLTEEIKEQHISEFSKGNLEKIGRFMEKRIYCVGFPNINNNKKLANLFEEDIQKDAEFLKNLIKESVSFTTPKEIPLKNHEHIYSSCCYLF